MTNLVKVAPAKNDNRVVVWEVHPDHPNGEVFIVGNGKPYEVAHTPRIAGLLGRGVLLTLQSNDSADDAPGADTDEDSEASESIFNVSEATIAGVLGAVVNGDISAEDALSQELEGKQRSTLIAQLEEMIDGGNADD